MTKGKEKKEKKNKKDKKHKKEKKHKKDKSTSKDDPKHVPNTRTVTLADDSRKRPQSSHQTSSAPKRAKQDPPATTNVRRSYTSASDSDNADQESHRLSRPMPPPKPSQSIAVGRSYDSDSDSDSSVGDRPPVARPKMASKPPQKIAVGRSYTSDSESDSSDDQARHLPRLSQPMARPTPAALSPPKLSTASAMSAPTGTSSRKKAKAAPGPRRPNTKELPRAVLQRPPVNQPTLPSARQVYASASDSDSTDDEAPQPSTSQPLPRPVSNSARSTITSDSDSSDSTLGSPPPIAAFRTSPAGPSDPLPGGPRTQAYIDTDEDSLDSDDDGIQQGQTSINTLLESLKSHNAKERNVGHKAALGDYSNNRLQTRVMYRNRDQDTNVEYRRRLVDEADKLNVQHDFFVSDSDSATDSEDDYLAAPQPWQATVIARKDLKNHIKTDAWPIKLTALNRNESIRMEKRVKKICRREGLSLEMFQQDLLHEHAKMHNLFWRKLAKPFPDRPLTTIIEHCRKTYHADNYLMKAWNADEDKKLVEYYKLHGNKQWKLIGEKMNRTAAHCRARFVFLKKKKDKVTKEDWTEEDRIKLLERLGDFKGSWDYFKWQSLATELFKKRHSGQFIKLQWQKRNSESRFTIKEKLAVIQRLQAFSWESEMDISFPTLSCEFGRPVQTLRSFYLSARSSVPEYERKSIQDILSILQKRFEAMTEGNGSE